MAAAPLRYFRLYGYFLRFSFSRAMEFRLDFFFRIVMDLVYYTVNIEFYRLIFLHTHLLAGWSEPQVMIFVSGYLFVDAVNMTVFSNNLWWLTTFVNRGDLDYYLVRPVSSLFFLSLRDFAANSFVNLLAAAGIVAWAVGRYPEPLSAGKVALYGALLLDGALLFYLLQMILTIPVFWTHSARGLSQIFWSLTRVMERPDRIFTGWVRVLFTGVLPFGLIASFPARLLLEEFDWAVLGHLLGLTAVFFAFTLGFWRLGLRSYSSASS